MPAPVLRSRFAPALAIAAMAAAMLIFGSNFAISRYAVLGGMTAADIVFLRYAVSGLLLLPVFARNRGFHSCAGIGWRRGLTLAAVSGAPMTMLMSIGVTFAPAAHGAALGPGTVTAVGVVYGAIVAGRLPPVLTRLGLVFVLGGLAAIAGAGSASGSANVVLGDICFFLCGLLWGFYPVLLHRWGVGGIEGAAICAVLSLLFVPVYLVAFEPKLLAAGPSVLAVQVVYQGVLNGVVGLWCWGVGIRVLGAKGTQLFPPMIPVIGSLAAIPLLAEWPGPFQVTGIALIVMGLALAALGNRPRSPV